MNNRSPLIVDAHVHIWAPHTIKRPWPNPVNAKPHTAYPLLNELGMSDDRLIAEMNAVGVDRAVIIPPSWEGHYNDLALAAVAKYPHRFAIMGSIDLEKIQSLGFLNEWKLEKGMLGLRCIFRSPNYQKAFLEGKFDWVWAAAEQAGVPVTLMAPALLETPAIVKSILIKFPNLKLSIDHLNIHAADPAVIAAMVDGFCKLACYSNFAIKVSAAPSWSQQEFPYRDVHDCIKKIFDAFGAQRVFWGSDFTRLDSGYSQALALFMSELSWLRGDDLRWVMGCGIAKWLGWELASGAS